MTISATCESCDDLCHIGMKSVAADNQQEIATLQLPDIGSIRLGDLDVLAEPDEVRKVLGYLPQETSIFRGMTVEQAAELFRTQAYQDEGNAQQQAVRGTFDPMYLSYTIGKLMIMKLRADYRAQCEAEGRPFSLREFHDRFLSYGAAPVPVIRRARLGAHGGSPL